MTEDIIVLLPFSALQTGVKVIITISIVMVVLVVIYSLLYRLCKERLLKVKG